MDDRLVETSTVVATLGGQPQVVTFALDALLERGERIREVLVLHLAHDNPRYGRSLARLAAEFVEDHYAGRPIRFRPIPIRTGAERLQDIRSEVEVEAAWQAVHELVSNLKTQGRRLHLCIAGGRRLLALLAMSAAMLHFGHHDRMWHLYTPEAFTEEAKEKGLLHARPGAGVQLIQVPVVPWGAYFPLLRTLAQRPAGQVVAAQAGWLETTEQSRGREVIGRLTRRQREVLRAFAGGSSPQDIAEELCISLKTVDSHKTVILTECRNAWSIPEDAWLDYHFLRDKFALLLGELI
ncbi:MAG: histidine kinase [Chloroflexia bacterium]|nr:histidine kinase [Chloroflexia bacterium]